MTFGFIQAFYFLDCTIYFLYITHYHNIYEYKGNEKSVRSIAPDATTKKIIRS